MSKNSRKQSCYQIEDHAVLWWPHGCLPPSVCAGAACYWKESHYRRHWPGVCWGAAQPGVRSVRPYSSWLPVFAARYVLLTVCVCVCVCALLYVCSTGRILVNERDQTSVDHIYAIGSVQHGRPSTTGLSVHAGTLLARRLYRGDSTLVISS